MSKVITTLYFFICYFHIALISVYLLTFMYFSCLFLFLIQSEDFFGLRRLYVILGSCLFYKVGITHTNTRASVAALLRYFYPSLLVPCQLNNDPEMAADTASSDSVEDGLSLKIHNEPVV